MRVRRLLPAVLLLSLGIAHPSAHNVAPEPTVDVFLRPAGEHLAVQVRLPVLALADANLPRNSDGHFAQDQIGPALVLVGRGVARDLELQQGDDVVPMPTVSASLSQDEASVTVDLDYLIRPDRTDLSARFHTFRAGGQLIRTAAHYVVDARTTRTFSIAGDPVRVAFDPSPGQAFQHFVALATDMLLSAGDFFLFAVCLIAPLRQRNALAGACMALLAGEALTMTLSGFNFLTVAPVALLAVQATAASAIVVAAIQDLVNPQSRWLTPLAFVFGMANGLDIGAQFLGESSFAGSHVVLGLLACLLVVALGQSWVVALLSSAAGLLRGRGGLAPLAVLALAIFAGHAALHRLIDRGQVLADGGSIALDRFLLILTLAWAGTILCAGIVDAMIPTRLRVSGPALADGRDSEAS